MENTKVDSLSIAFSLHSSIQIRVTIYDGKDWEFGKIPDPPVGARGTAKRGRVKIALMSDMSPSRPAEQK
jgi:hypothetical protein